MWWEVGAPWAVGASFGGLNVCAGAGAGLAAGLAAASFERPSEGEGPKLRTRTPMTRMMATEMDMRRVLGLMDAGRGAIVYCEVVCPAYLALQIRWTIFREPTTWDSRYVLPKRGSGNSGS